MLDVKRPALISVTRGTWLRVLLEVHREHARGLAIDRADRPDRDLEHPRLVDGLGERADRRHLAGLTGAAEVRQALVRLREGQAAVLPHALAAEITARQVLGQGERGDRDPPHRAPISDPAPSLVRPRDRRRAPRARTRADATPRAGRIPQPLEDALEPPQVGHPMGRGRGHAARPQPLDEDVLVAAALHRGGPGKEEPPVERAPRARERGDVSVAGGDDEVDPLRFHDPAQRPSATPDARSEGRDSCDPRWSS